jgi:beta-N-acetylhexosaminidase
MINSLLDLTIQQKIGQLFFIGIAGTSVDDQTRRLLQRIEPGGVCLFARNIKEAKQTRDLIDSIRSVNGTDPFISLDQEGGLVDRLRRVMTPMPAANKIRDAATAAKLGKIISESIRILGFNMDFAPVVDVIDERRENSNNGMYSRSFGRNAVDVTEIAGAFLKSLQNGGCIGCIKHFPGLGAAAVDSHEELPSVNISADELRSTDLVPYKRLFEGHLVHSVMIAHAAYPNTGLQEATSDGKLLPSSLSIRVITDLLRKELKFDGLVITDDLEMGAIIRNFGIGDACVMAVEAGSDMLAICADAGRINDGFEAMLKAVRSGRITEDRVDESITRIAVAKSLLKDPLPFSAERLAELSDDVASLNDEVK